MSFNYNQNFFSNSATELLSEEDVLLRNKFESISEDLDALVQLGADKGGLSKDDLLAIYIKGKNSSVEILDADTQQFFSEMISKRNNRSFASHDDYVINELVSAIARAISRGRMRAETIYTSNSSGAVEFAIRKLKT